MTESTYFEFPLTQIYRHFLRVEAALSQLHALNNIQSHNAQQSSLLILDNLLSFLSRVDIKVELIKTFETLIHWYQELSKNPEVDSVKLTSFLEKMKKLHNWAIQYQGKIGENLRQHPLLSSLSNRQSIQTGVIAADNCELWLFCNKDIQDVQKQIKHWLCQLEGLEKSISVILRLARESGKITQVDAPMGDYLIEKPPANATILRIMLSNNHHIFPEVSAGKHRISIHFFCQSDDYSKFKYRDKVDFKFSLCH